LYSIYAGKMKMSSVHYFFLLEAVQHSALGKVAIQRFQSPAQFALLRKISQFQELFTNWF